MRTIIDIPDEKVRELDRIRKERGGSRAGLVRQALDDFLRHQHEGLADKAFGLWRGRQVDGLKYQDSLRREWDR